MIPRNVDFHRYKWYYYFFVFVGIIYIVGFSILCIIRVVATTATAVALWSSPSDELTAGERFGPERNQQIRDFTKTHSISM